MVGSIRQEGNVRLGEEGRAASIALGKDDFVEEFDCRILRARRFALVDEFVEGLRVAQHVHVLAVAVRDAFEELVDAEAVEHAGFAVLAGGRVEEAAVGVEEGGEAAHERRADLIGAESDGADERHAAKTAVVGDD